MTRLFPPSARPRRALLAVLVGAMAVLGVATVAPTASASTDPTIDAVYPVTGSTTLHSNGASISLGPGSLSSVLDVATLDFTANLSLPPSTSSFTELGLVPVTATTEFIQDGPVTGQDVDGGIVSTAKITIRITDLKLAGIEAPVGPHCQSIQPATLSLTSGPDFNVLLGGTVSGTYTIPLFANCLLNTGLLDLTIPGPDNKITLTLATPTVTTND